MLIAIICVLAGLICVLAGLVVCLFIRLKDTQRKTCNAIKDLKVSLSAYNFKSYLADYKEFQDGVRRGFDQVHKRIDKIEDHMESFEKAYSNKMDTHEEILYNFDDIEDRVTRLNTFVTNQLSLANERINKIYNALDELEDHVDEYIEGYVDGYLDIDGTHDINDCFECLQDLHDNVDRINDRLERYCPYCYNNRSKEDLK